VNWELWNPLILHEIAYIWLNQTFFKMKTIVLILGFALLGNVRGQGSETPDTLEMTPKLIAAFMEEFDDAWNRRDLDDFCAMFTADGSMHFITLGQHHKNPFT
jgi:hypothetical protein